MPRIDSDNPEHADEIRDAPATFAQDLILGIMIELQSRGLPLGEYEELKVEDIGSMTIKEGEVAIILKPK